MSLAPETATSPLAQAPPDRPSRDLEQIAAEFLAVLMRDGGIDANEMRIVRGVWQQVAAKIQQQGGLLNSDVSAAQQQQGGGDPGMSPMEMNATGAEDYGSGQGDPMYQDDSDQDGY